MSDLNHRRVSFSLPSDLIDNLDLVAGHLECSRSALVSELLSSVLSTSLEIINALPPPDSPPESVRRFRGESARIIGDQVSRLLSGGQDDLFK